MKREELEAMMNGYTGKVTKLPTPTVEEQKHSFKEFSKKMYSQHTTVEEPKRSIVYRYHPTLGEVAFDSVTGEQIS